MLTIQLVSFAVLIAAVVLIAIIVSRKSGLRKDIIVTGSIVPIVIFTFVFILLREPPKFLIVLMIFASVLSIGSLVRAIARPR
ncbi:hypothetical protein GKZ89_15975 [Bacillus mangrovi]|uniref:Uncharacterized protein n=1 Tax=Metabacillus mangrovi TaxID=1491830 RepID=A0A7X2V661_9BACI|nr:hypothetical protein [Metabacillus mangrovi]MTH54901.1 hypothetical protein [Metabacillus mangrovi]